MSETGRSSGFHLGGYGGEADRDGDPDRDDTTVDVYRSGDLDERSSDRSLGPLDTSGRRPGVDLYKSRGLEPTPAEIAARKQNRRWMAGFVIPSLVLLVLALIATAVYESNEPSGPKQAAPAGYQTENDGYFSYVVPKSWSNNQEFTDADGDVETSGSSGFVGENISYQKDAPTLLPPGSEANAQSLGSFGMAQPEPYTLKSGRRITVAGASPSFEYTVERPGGFRAVAIDSYDYRAAVELWLIVKAPPAATSKLVSSLKA